jgi:hypothetical protein
MRCRPQAALPRATREAPTRTGLRAPILPHGLNVVLVTTPPTLADWLLQSFQASSLTGTRFYSSRRTRSVSDCSQRTERQQPRRSLTSVPSVWLTFAEYARYFLQTTGVVRPNETIKLPSWEYLHPVENFLQRVRSEWQSFGTRVAHHVTLLTSSSLSLTADAMPLLHAGRDQGHRPSARQAQAQGQAGRRRPADQDPPVIWRQGDCWIPTWRVGSQGSLQDAAGRLEG